jgi:hypothetical protein
MGREYQIKSSLTLFILKAEAECDGIGAPPRSGLVQRKINRLRAFAESGLNVGLGIITPNERGMRGTHG